MAIKNSNHPKSLKQVILHYLYNKLFSNFGMFSDYPLETFQSKSVPIIEQLLQIDGMRIDRPTSICDGGPCFRYVQSAIKHLADKPQEHVAIQWQLQDDGDVKNPYPVIEVIKYKHHNKDCRDGIATVGITHIYPSQIPNLQQIINNIVNHPIQP